MSRIKKTLVYSSADVINISRRKWFRDKLLNDFNIECFDPANTYNSSTHVLVIDRYAHNRSGWHQPFQERGFKTIVKCVWDSGKYEATTVENQILNLRVKEWPWIYSYFMNQSLNYAQRQEHTVDADKFFLLLMNLKRDSRDHLLHYVKPYLQDSLYSYRGRGITIDGDDPAVDASFVSQHYFNPSWYEQTNFSLVSETLPMTNPPEQLFVSEKTFKPIALMHPFIVHGSRGTLSYLHKLGFETFDHVIDESYDLGATITDRMKSINVLLDTLYQEFKKDKILFGDAESQRRIQHNYNRFYDESIIDQLWQTQIVDVIQEFVDG